MVQEHFSVRIKQKLLNYSPSKTEIIKRKTLIDIMRIEEWNSLVMDSIMHEDNPTIDVVFELIEKHGRKEAYRRLKSFIE